jgi:hypothetical protein
MTKKSHLLKEIGLSNLGTPQQAKSIEDIRSLKKDQEVSAKKQAQPAQKNNQVQTQQPSEQVNLNQNTQQVAKQTKEPVQKKTTQKQEISDENFKGILEYLNNIDLSNLDENDKKLLDFISSNVKKFTNQQKVELKKNNTIIEYFINNNKISTKTATEKNIEFLVNEQDKYLMFYDNAIDNNIKNKFDKSDGNLIKTDKDFEIFVKNIIENFKNIISSSLIKQEVPNLNFLQDKIFLLIEDTKGKGYEPRFICVSSNFEYSKKTKKLNFKVKIDRGETKNIQSGSEYSYTDNLKDDVTFSYGVHKITQLHNVILKSYNNIISNPFSLLKILFQGFNQKDSTVADEIQKAEKEKKEEEENAKKSNSNQIQTTSNPDQNQNSVNDQKQNKKVTSDENFFIEIKDLYSSMNSTYDKKIDELRDEENLIVYVSPNEKGFAIKEYTNNANNLFTGISIEDISKSKKYNLGKFIDSLVVLAKTYIRNEAINYYNETKEKKKEESFEKYFLNKFKSSKIATAFQQAFKTKDDISFLLLNEVEAKKLSNEKSIIKCNRNDANVLVDLFSQFQDKLKIHIVKKCLDDIPNTIWDYTNLKKQEDINIFKDIVAGYLIEPKSNPLISTEKRSKADTSSQNAATNNQTYNKKDKFNIEYEDFKNENLEETGKNYLSYVGRPDIPKDKIEINSILKIFLTKGKNHFTFEFDCSDIGKTTYKFEFNRKVEKFYTSDNSLIQGNNKILYNLDYANRLIPPAGSDIEEDKLLYYILSVLKKNDTDEKNSLATNKYATKHLIEILKELFDNKFKTLDDFEDFVEKSKIETYNKIKDLYKKKGFTTFRQKSIDNYIKNKFHNFADLMSKYIVLFFLHRFYDYNNVVGSFYAFKKFVNYCSDFDPQDNSQSSQPTSQLSTQNSNTGAPSTSNNTDSSSSTQPEVKNVEQTNNSENTKIEKSKDPSSKTEDEKREIRKARREQIKSIRQNLLKYCFFNKNDFSHNIQYAIDNVANQENKNLIIEKLKQIKKEFTFDLFNEIEDEKNIQKIIDNVEFTIEKSEDFLSVGLNPHKENDNLRGNLVMIFLKELQPLENSQKDEIIQSIFNYIINNFEIQLNLDEITDFSKTDIVTQDKESNQNTNSAPEVQNSNITPGEDPNKNQQTTQDTNKKEGNSNTKKQGIPLNFSNINKSNIRYFKDSNNKEIFSDIANENATERIQRLADMYFVDNYDEENTIMDQIINLIKKKSDEYYQQKTFPFLPENQKSFSIGNIVVDMHTTFALSGIYIIIRSKNEKMLGTQIRILIAYNEDFKNKVGNNNKCHIDAIVASLPLLELLDKEAKEELKSNKENIKKRIEEREAQAKNDAEEEARKENESKQPRDFENIQNNSFDGKYKLESCQNYLLGRNGVFSERDFYNIMDKCYVKKDKESIDTYIDKLKSNQEKIDNVKISEVNFLNYTGATDLSYLHQSLMIPSNKTDEKYSIFISFNKLQNIVSCFIGKKDEDPDGMRIFELNFKKEAANGNILALTKIMLLSFMKKIMKYLEEIKSNSTNSSGQNNTAGAAGQNLDNNSNKDQQKPDSSDTNTSNVTSNQNQNQNQNQNDYTIFSNIDEEKAEAKEASDYIYSRVWSDGLLNRAKEKFGKFFEIKEYSPDPKIPYIFLFTRHENNDDKRLYITLKGDQTKSNISGHLFAPKVATGSFIIQSIEKPCYINCNGIPNIDEIELVEIIEQIKNNNKGEKGIYIFGDWVENTNENFSILKIKGQKLILEETQKSQNENTHLDFSYFKSQKKEIQNLIKQYEKEEDSKAKSSIEKKIREKQREISNQITLQSIKNFVNNIKSLRNANNGNSQKLVKQMSKRLGFEPSPLEFSIQSLNKFKNMSEFSRVISNIILTNIMLQLTQLNAIYTIFSNDKIDENVIRDAFMQLENDFKRLVKSLQEKEVSSKFEELSEKISENFGTDSSVHLETKDTYEKVMSYYQKQYKSLTEFKKSLSDFWENYSKIEKEEEKVNQRKNMISQFIEIRDSKEIKQIYKVYLVNNSFFNDKLRSIIDANSKLSYNEILTSHGYETFESIYQKEKQIFDKTFKKCNEVLGKSIGQGKLGKLFDDLEKIKTNLENIKPAQENKKEGNQEKSNETQNSQDKQKTDLNKNIKPETENKGDKTEETSGNKTESKKIKQGLKFLNNNTELKIYQRKK